MDNGFLDHVLADFTNAISADWGPGLQIIMAKLLLAIIVLQFGLIAVDCITNHDISRLLMDLVLGIIRIGVVYAVFINLFDWGNDVVQTGVQIGQTISTLSPLSLTPSGVWNTGLILFKTILQAKASGGWLTGFVQWIQFFVVAVTVMLCWLGAAIVYFGALLEAAALVYGGSLVIAFSPLGWTFEIFMHWVMSVLGIAVKLAILLMTLAVGMVLANEWTANIAATSTTFTTNVWNLLFVVAESLVFVYLVWKLPLRFTRLIGGSPLFSFGEAVLAMAAGSIGSRAASAEGKLEKAAATAGKALAGEGAQAARSLAAKVQSMLVK
jgi:P-type conjugative transfer protein TrbL